jgi:hypothetical protein
LCVPRTFSRQAETLPVSIRSLEENRRPIQKTSRRHRSLPAEEENLRFDPVRELEGQGIVGVEHGKILLPLVLKDPALGLAVGLEAGITVQVVLGDIQEDGNLRPELLDPFQLVAAELDHRPFLFLETGHEANQRVADVSAHKSPLPPVMEHRSDHRGGGGLAVGPGDAHRGPAQEAKGQFDLADHRNSLSPRLIQLLQAQRDPGADDDQFGPQKEGDRVPSHLPFHRKPSQRLPRGLQFLRLLDLRYPDFRPFLGQKAHRRFARSGQTDDQDFFASKIHIRNKM